jgi:hypothetical protein
MGRATGGISKRISELSKTFFSFLAEKQLYQTQPEVIKLLNSRAAVFLLMKILRTFAEQACCKQSCPKM